MKKILIISSLLLFINMAFASDLIIADSTKNKSETRLVIFGKFDKSNTVVTIDIYYSPLTGSIDDEWGYDKRLQLSNNYVLTFDIDQIYMLVILMMEYYIMIPSLKLIKYISLNKK